MQLYRVYDNDLPASDQQVEFAGTFDGAKTIMKQTNEQFRCCIQVDLIDVPSDKDSMLAALNGGMPKFTVLKSWRGTARGGLKEVTS